MILLSCNLKPLTHNSVPQHQHDHWEFHYVSSGQCGFMIDGELLDIRTGSFFSIPPKSEHGLKMTKKGDWLLQYIISLSPENTQDVELLQAWQKHQEKNAVVLHHLRPYFFERCIIDIKGHGWQRQSAIHRFCSLICECMSGEKENKEIHPAINICIEHFHQHFQGSVQLQTLAKLTHLDPSYLVRLFKKEMSVTPLYYFQRLKMNMAAESLRQKSTRIQEIGYDFGFDNPSQFSRSFKTIFGVSPKAYQNSIRS